MTTWLLLLAILLIPSLALSQDALDSDADSVVRNDGRLFDSSQIARDTLPRSKRWNRFGLPSFNLWPSTFPLLSVGKELLQQEDRPPFLIDYNRADGLFLGIGTGELTHAAHRKIGERISTDGGFGYSFGSHYWQVYGGLWYDLFDKLTPLRIGGEGHILTDTRDAWKVGRFENGLSSLLAGVDSRDYFQKHGFSLSAQNFLSTRIVISGEFRFDRYENSRREISWSLFGPHQPFLEVPPIREGTIASGRLGLLFDYMTLTGVDRFRWGFETAVERGTIDDKVPQESLIPKSNLFTSYLADLRVRTPLIGKILWGGLHLRMGIGTGDVPAQKLFTIGGLGTIPGYPQNAYEGNRMLLLQTEVMAAPFIGFKPLSWLRFVITNDVAAVSSATEESGPLAGWPSGIESFKYSPGIYLTSTTAIYRIGWSFRTDIYADPKLVIRIDEPF